MKSFEIRESFIKFFERYHHKFIPSSPVVPFDDPTLLFANAGMNQFKNILLGLEKRAYTRATNSQKCIRVSGKHNDLEEVGKDTYHHTFFEMLGNWSFGDYYKKEAIVWAWELLTEIWKLPKANLWATVFREDDDAEHLWKTVTDIKKSHVLRFDEKDNFWEMGDVGPCGPCSEIHIDVGESACNKKHVKNHRCGVNSGCSRFIELWNLVFIQFNRETDGSLKELPSKHVDTGMGFERVTAVIQGVLSNYESDLFTPIVAKITELTGKEYQGGEAGTTHRVLADHIRALTFAIADGALPSNEGRGYVLRRILRRAARYARNLDMHEPLIYKLVPTVVDLMGDAFPEIAEKHQYVSMVIKAEEESFNHTVDRGIELFEKLVHDLERKGIHQIPGKEAFRLYDTYGFPLDLTQLMASETQFTVDVDGFQSEMELQRKRARESGKWAYAVDFNYDQWRLITQGVDSQFVGYYQLETQSVIRRIKQEGDHIFLTLDSTPFYGEAGGQVGDRGEIVGDNFILSVINTIREGEKIIHIAEGSFPKKGINPGVVARVNIDLRLSIARNHTATHLLQAALREVLGKHVHQSGSLVASDRLRFDLTHFEKISKDQLQLIEKIVNQKIMENLPVTASEISLSAARREGAMMLFGEKYDERVRMIQIENYSKELCGGTHLNATGEMGSFRIISESSVAAGIRRIEAITGGEVIRLSVKERDILEKIAQELGSPQESVVERIQSILNENKILERELLSLQTQQSRSEIIRLVGQAKAVDNFKLVTAHVKCTDIENLKQLGDQLRQELRSGVGILGAIINEKGNFICVVTDDLIKEKKFNASELVKQVAAIAEGSGGGRPHMALAGAKNINKFSQALEQSESIIRKQLE